MKLKNLVQDAADLLGLDAHKNSINRSILFRCANLVVSNIACNYEDCITTQTFIVSNGRIDLNQFDKIFLKVKKICCGNQPVNYDLYIDFLSVPNGRITVVYAFIPKFKNEREEIIKITGKIDENILLYGILAEYASISGLSEEFKNFNAKFENLLFANSQTGKGRVLPV